MQFVQVLNLFRKISFFTFHLSSFLPCLLDRAFLFTTIALRCIVWKERGPLCFYYYCIALMFIYLFYFFAAAAAATRQAVSDSLKDLYMRLCRACVSFLFTVLRVIHFKTKLTVFRCFFPRFDRIFFFLKNMWKYVRYASRVGSRTLCAL